jgi:hypothetical protein
MIGQFKKAQGGYTHVLVAIDIHEVDRIQADRIADNNKGNRVPLRNYI